jgi:hypothetical protein
MANSMQPNRQVLAVPRRITPFSTFETTSLSKDIRFLGHEQIKWSVIYTVNW